MAEPCTNSELTARITALESDIRAQEKFLNERDKRYEQRAISQDTAVATALAAADRAVTKAEVGTERRLEGLNELRQLAVDQALSFARKDEVTLLIRALEVRIQSLDDQVKTTFARGGGLKDAWGYLVAAAGVIIAIVALFLRH